MKKALQSTRSELQPMIDTLEYHLREAKELREDYAQTASLEVLAEAYETSAKEAVGLKTRLRQAWAKHNIQVELNKAEQQVLNRAVELSTRLNYLLAAIVREMKHYNAETRAQTALIRKTLRATRVSAKQLSK